MAYVKRNATNSLKNSIDYILDKNKTDDLLVYGNQLLNMNTDEIVKQMNLTKANFNKMNGIQGHHFIQSFSPDEEIDLALAHQVGIEWSEKFISDYEFVLATHKDKDHIHNHIIINSVNVKDGKKYLSNIAEREYIRDLSDEVCKEYNLSIIQRKNKSEKNLSYAEWKYRKQGISWKDKIKNDIDKAIKHSTTYDDFIYTMKDKNYTMRYGDRYKYNSFEHFDIGKRIRGKTLGENYTEEKIQERILNKELDYSEEREFNQENYFVNGVSNKEIVSTDIDLSILESETFNHFIESMKDKNYTMRYGDRYKHNSFKHEDMKRSIRGRTIGYDYTEEKIQERISVNKELLMQSKNKTEINIQKRVVFSKRYINNKFKYINVPQLHSNLEKEEMENRREAIQENSAVEFLREHGLTDVNKYLLYKVEIQKTLSQSIKVLDKKVSNHNELLKKYNENKTSDNRKIVLESKDEVENYHEKIVELQQIQKQFKYIDNHLLKEEEKRKEERDKENGEFIR